MFKLFIFASPRLRYNAAALRFTQSIIARVLEAQQLAPGGSAGGVLQVQLGEAGRLLLPRHVSLAGVLLEGRTNVTSTTLNDYAVGCAVGCALECMVTCCTQPTTCCKPLRCNSYSIQLPPSPPSRAAQTQADLSQAGNSSYIQPIAGSSSCPALVC